MELEYGYRDFGTSIREIPYDSSLYSHCFSFGPQAQDLPSLYVFFSLLLFQFLPPFVSDPRVKMKSFVAGLAAALATIASAAPPQNEAKRATTPKVYLAGDSTMALGGGRAGTQGMSLILTRGFC